MARWRKREELINANVRNEEAKAIAMRVDMRQVTAWGLGCVFEE